MYFYFSYHIFNFQKFILFFLILFSAICVSLKSLMTLRLVLLWQFPKGRNILSVWGVRGREDRESQLHILWRMGFLFLSSPPPSKVPYVSKAFGFSWILRGWIFPLLIDTPHVVTVRLHLLLFLKNHLLLFIFQIFIEISLSLNILFSYSLSLKGVYVCVCVCIHLLSFW